MVTPPFSPPPVSRVKVAPQADSKAIAAILAQHMPAGISVRVLLKAAVLQVMLETVPLPASEANVAPLAEELAESDRSLDGDIALDGDIDGDINRALDFTLLDQAALVEIVRQVVQMLVETNSDLIERVKLYAWVAGETTPRWQALLEGFPRASAEAKQVS